MRIVAREISCDGMPEASASAAIQRVLLRAMGSAHDAILSDAFSEEALHRAHEYLALSEMVVSFGSTLAAMDDIEEHDISETRDKAGEAQE